ncbi:hypothetical protein [Facilibium subflavum]|uniref:hypothetical protein n=1 Tax=Facilibium subflavum TaxID=2219058 RepID=UPI000E64FD48|nr:hypothetical protein [Facilibium subflavum]
MHSRQSEDLQQLLARFNARHSLCISFEELPFFEQLKALHHYDSSGFLKKSNARGARFSADQWPFPGKLFEVIILVNVFFEDEAVNHAIAKEVTRVLSDDGYLLIVQETNIPLRSISKWLYKEKLEKTQCHYYDDFAVNRLSSWLSCVFPQVYSCCFTACFAKNVLPLTPLFANAGQLKPARSKYAVDIKAHS